MKTARQRLLNAFSYQRSRIRNRASTVTSLAVALIVAAEGGTAWAGSLYRKGDFISDFVLTDRATGRPVHLTDFEGKIVLLDWFAWWCPYCQAAVPQLLTGVDEWYAARHGNPAGIPVIHVGVNLQPGQEPQTQNFVSRAQFPQVLQDFNRTVANRFALDGQPIFAIINGVTNSTNHKPYELLYSRLGYGQSTFPVAEFRAAIDSVKAAPAAPPALTSLIRNSDGSFQFTVSGSAGVSYSIERSDDLRHWSSVRSYTALQSVEVIQVSSVEARDSHYFRWVIP